MDRPKPAGTCRTTGAQGVGRPADPREREIAIDTAQGLTHQEFARRTRRRPPRPPRWPPGVAWSDTPSASARVCGPAKRSNPSTWRSLQGRWRSAP